MIDPHVHLRDGSQSAKETILHGLTVASGCGVDMVFDMPNCEPALTNAEVITQRLDLAEKAVQKVKEESGRNIGYGLYAGLTADEQQIQEVVDCWRNLFPHVVGLKLFAGNSTGNMGQVSEDAQRHIYHVLAHEGFHGVLAVHCEKESQLVPTLENKDDFSSHSLARPLCAEVSSVKDQIRFAMEEGFKGHLHICHLSAVESLEYVEQARKDGLSITTGVTPHHLLLSSFDAKDRHLYAKMNPPLRDEAHRLALVDALLKGRIDWVETDHAPHTLSDKENGASGIPGFSGCLLLLDALYKTGLAKPTLRSLFGGRVLSVFGLPERDITLVPPDACRELSDRAAQQYPYDSYAVYRKNTK